MWFTKKSSPEATLQKQAKSAWRFAVMSGWQNTALCLTVLIAVLTTILLICLMISLFGLGTSSASILRTTLLFQGNCGASSNYNLWIHLAINIISSGVLASSNFFMQVMVAPTREDVNKAHARGKWVEIGVQSWRNLFHVPARNGIFWVLLAISSVPLHLVFNSCVLESRASTDFVIVVASESFTHGAAWSIPGVAMKKAKYSDNMNRTVAKIAQAVSGPSSPTAPPWERISVEECIARYDNIGTVLTDHRHVVMVVSNNAESSTTGWAADDVLVNPVKDGYLSSKTVNSIWYAEAFGRTDEWIRERAESTSQNKFKSDVLEYIINLDASSRAVRNNGTFFREPFQTMKAQYCLSEAFSVPCRLEVENTLLLIVCIICVVKCTLCITIISTSRRRVPLITPGDAIESFITKPDNTTVGMCTFSQNDFTNRQPGSNFTWVASPRAWKHNSRRSGSAVPGSIWAWSYLLIGSSLAVGTIMFAISLREQPL
jgi:hypothetical protein